MAFRPATITNKFLSSSSKEIGLVAACFKGGQARHGVENGPREFLRPRGLVDQLSSAPLNYIIHGDIRADEHCGEMKPNIIGLDEPHRGMRNPRLVSAATKLIADKVYAHARAGRLVVTLGGDHSIGLGTVAGTAKAMRERFNFGDKKTPGSGSEKQKKPMAVIWVDAHADINTPETSSSGNMHGMPLAFLTGLATSTSTPDREGILGWLGDEHRIAFENLVYIGVRDLDESEKMTIRSRGILAFSIHDVRRLGIASVLDMTLEHIGPDVPIHLGFDIDALDPYWAPCTGMPTEQGLSLREGCVIAERLHDSGQLVALDLVEVNPSINPEGLERTVCSGISVIKSALGYSLL